MTQEILDNLIAIRRAIHENPETGYQEFKTAAIIMDFMGRLKIPYDINIAGTGTGIMATLSKGDGPCIALRADMDALPIQEVTGLPFSSKKENVMHACGHDVHTTILLGAAQLLKQQDFNGTVKFIFQPSEENNAGDPVIDKDPTGNRIFKSGGQRIAESSLLDQVDAAIALHVHPLLPVGQIAFTPGQALACASFFRMVVYGKAGHAGASPHLTVDAIFIASHVVQAAQSIISRNVSPTEPAVISFTKINGGTAENITADKVTMEGTIRALDLATYNNVITRLKHMLTGIAATFEAGITFDLTVDYPSLLNDAALQELLVPPLAKVFGPGGFKIVPPMLAGEDFAFYSRKVPVMFYFLGAKDDAQENYFLHHPKMVVNEACIPFGVTFLTEAAMALMK